MTQNAINSAKTVSQRATTTTSSVVTCSTAIPADDTIPQSTEGNEVLTLAITPKSSTSTLLIEFTSPCSKDANAGSISVALFQDSTANALAASCLLTVDTSKTQLVAIRHIMTSGTTSSTTFKIRVGPSANSCYINGDATGGAVMNGTSQTRLSITEYI